MFILSKCCCDLHGSFIDKKAVYKKGLLKKLRKFSTEFLRPKKVHKFVRFIYLQNLMYVILAFL